MTIRIRPRIFYRGGGGPSRLRHDRDLRGGAVPLAGDGGPEAAERAQARQALAHTVIEGRSQSQILQAAAAALHQIFRAPAAIPIQCENRFEAVATAGSVQITEADREAARGALSSHENTRRDTHPYVGAYFDSGRSRHPLVATVSWASILGMRRVNGRIHPNKSSR